VADAALAKKAGGSGLSGTLSSNPAVRRQQLIADPDYPTAGQTSIAYNPGIVSVSGLDFGPGYGGSASVEVTSDNETYLVDLAQYLAQPFGQQTGYLQVRFNEPVITQAAIVAPGGHGQIAVAAGFTTVDQDGPAAVDTHAVFFDYLPGVGGDRVAEYTLYADPGDRASGNTADFLRGVDDAGQPFELAPGDIASATVRGSLNVIPVPPAALIGGLTLGGLAAARLLRRR
jgi:hypothetical protein